MPEPRFCHAQAAQAGFAARGLASGQTIDRASLVLSALALAALLFSKPAASAYLALIGTVIAGAAEKFFALRVAFDQAIFADWSRRWESGGETTPEADLSAFDTALADLGLGRTGDSAPRPLIDRIHGAFRLLRWQATLAAAQLLALLIAISIPFVSIHHGL